jgi:hypothetical protein
VQEENHEEQTAFGPQSCFSDLPLGADGRSKDAAGPRLDNPETLSIRFNRFNHG